MTAAGSTAPQFPPELWTKVLKSLDREEDLPMLWMTCRHVCTIFRDDVESIFRNQHLPETVLQWDLGTTLDSEEENVHLEIKYKFHAVSNDNKVATFEGDETGEKHRHLVGSVLSRTIEETASIYDIIAPTHQIRVHRRVNDTPIPCLALEYGTLQLSVDWRGMYTRFFGTEMLEKETLDVLAAEYDKNIREEELKRKIRHETSGDMRIFVPGLQRVQDMLVLTDKAEVVARRSCIRRQFREIGAQPNWDFESPANWEEEDRIIRKLQSLRSQAKAYYRGEFLWDDGDVIRYITT